MVVLTDYERGLRGKATLLKHIYKTGYTIAGRKVWTTEEMEILYRLHPDYTALLNALPGRTLKAIKRKAGSCGLFPSRQIWTPDEKRQLPKPYKAGLAINELLILLPGKTKKQIWAKASNMKIRRPRRPPRYTGLLLVDPIRQRAFEEGYYMADLDSWVGYKHYFGSPRYVSWQAIDAAMSILGGKLVARWQEEP
jgi:hypothetical protein